MVPLRSSRGRRGFALAVCLLVIALVAIVTFTAVSVSTLDQRASRQDVRAAQAAYGARAGLNHARARLETDYFYAGTGSGTPSGSEASLDDEVGYAVRVEPASWNPTTELKTWKITTTGCYQDAERTMIAYAGLESFAKYAYFTDRDVTQSGAQIWFTSFDKITGPAHTNGFFSFSGSPKFSATTTSANLEDARYSASSGTYSQSGVQTDPFRFHRTFTGYSSDHPAALDDSPEFSFAGGQKDIPLPKDTGLIKTAANAAGTAFSSSLHNWDKNSKYQIVVDESDPNGKVTAVQRQAGGTFSNVPETQAPPIYKLEFQSDGQLSVYKKEVGSSTAWSLQDTVSTNEQPGVTLHVDGFVLLKGTVQGRVTLGSTYDMHSIEDLVYADTNRDVLGIVSEQNFIVQSNKSKNKDRKLHASILTLNGSFTVDDFSQGGARGNLKIFGGLIQKYRGPVGTFFNSGGVPVVASGYKKDYEYDQKLLNRPPLNFPTTGTVIVRSLIDQGAAGSL